MQRRPRLLVCIGELLAYAGQSTVVTQEIECLTSDFDITVVVDRLGPGKRLPVETVVLQQRGSWREQESVFRGLASDTDIIHCHDSLRFMWWSAHTGKPWIVTSHGIAPLRYRSGLGSALQGAVTMAAYPYLYGRATAVVAISEWIGAWLRRKGVQGVVVIPNGSSSLVDVDSHMPADGNLLYVGEVSRRKGIVDLVRVATVLPEATTITVVGSGPMTGYLAERGSRGGCAHIQCLGAVPDDMLQTLMSTAFCTLSASYWEGFGLPIVEGFAHGRPALVRRTSGMAELIQASGAGAVFDSPDEVPEKLEWMRREWRYLSGRAYAYAAKWSWGDAMLQYRRLLWDVLGRGSA